MNSSSRTLGRSKFESEIQVRPDDIDMFQHVHNSRYFDYVLAARFDQMGRCYKMTIEEFVKAGYGWYVATAHMEYRRPLKLGNSMIVRTWVDEITEKGVKVRFEIWRKDSDAVSCDGYFDYVLVSLKTGRGELIPDWILDKCSI